MGNQAIARWFLESVGAGGKGPVDLWELAKLWGFVVRLRTSGSARLPTATEVIWLDPDETQEERRESLAHELASLAIEISDRDGDQRAVARHLLAAAARPPACAPLSQVPLPAGLAEVVPLRRREGT
jgi:hypothetical protein